MKIRLITGTCYIAVLLVFFLLKIFVSDLFFDALIYAFALIGTFEMTRAMKEKITKAEKIAVFAFAALCIPACALFEEFLGAGLEGAAVCFFALAVALLSLLVARHDETSPENLGVAFLCAVYPNLLLALLTLANHLGGGETLSRFALNSDLAILFIFVISPFADSLAYVFGRFLKGPIRRWWAASAVWWADSSARRFSIFPITPSRAASKIWECGFPSISSSDFSPPPRPSSGIWWKAVSRERRTSRTWENSCPATAVFSIA